MSDQRRKEQVGKADSRLCSMARKTPFQFEQTAEAGPPFSVYGGTVTSSQVNVVSDRDTVNQVLRYPEEQL